VWCSKVSTSFGVLTTHTIVLEEGSVTFWKLNSVEDASSIKLNEGASVLVKMCVVIDSALMLDHISTLGSLTWKFLMINCNFSLMFWTLSTVPGFSDYISETGSIWFTRWHDKNKETYVVRLLGRADGIPSGVGFLS